MSSTPQTTPLTETVRDFLEPKEFYDLLTERDINFFTGVPDSLLKDFCAYVHDHTGQNKHILAANEGASIGIATGYHMATGKVPFVYMQNSGFGNAVNPLLSLADPGVYGVPMLLMIGWRGEPGKKDEPQHLIQGKRMTSMLTDLRINFEVLPDFIDGARDALDLARHSMKLRPGPYAFLVKRQTFSPYKSLKLQKAANDLPFKLNREQAIDIIIGQVAAWDVMVCTTGFASRELFELRVKHKQDHSRDFLTVGSMGHASAIALGVATAKPSRQIFCLDGDGAALMHLGTMGTVGRMKSENFKHVLFNNGAHDSVGAQPTGALGMNFPDVAVSLGYKEAFVCETADELSKGIERLAKSKGPAFMEVRVLPGARSNLGRPTTSTYENKEAFMKFLHN